MTYFCSFTIDSVLGRGSQGIVYKAQDNSSGVNVVLKLIPLKNSDAAEKAKALKEARMLQSLEHDKIVRCFGSFEHGGSIVIIMCVSRALARNM